MPSAQVIDLGRDLSKNDNSLGGIIQQLADTAKSHQDKQEIGNLIGAYQKNREDANAWEDLQLGLQKSDISPSRRIQTQNELNDMKKLVIENNKTLNTTAKSLQEKNNNTMIIRDLEKRNNLAEGTLDPYISDPKMAQKVVDGPKSALSEKPIDPDQLQKIKATRESEGFDDLDELGQYRKFTDAGVSRANAESESKLRGEQLKRLQTTTDKAYDTHKDFIEETTNKYKSFETEMKPKLMQMQSIPDEDLIGPTASVFLDYLGIPLGSLADPSSELYKKLSLDLLKGLPETFGNRILKVEVDNFLQTIPQLSNSADGRRMIASNILKLGEMKEVYYKEMRRQQKDFGDTGKPLPKDWQQEVFDQVKPQIDRINDEFVKLIQIKKVPPGEVPFFDPDGNIIFIPKNEAKDAIKNGGKRIW